jgi:hypothetical protein
MACSAIRYGKEVTKAESGFRMNYLTPKPCTEPALHGGDLCLKCDWRYNGGKGFPKAYKHPEQIPPWAHPGQRPKYEWHGRVGDIHPDSTIEGSAKFLRDIWRPLAGAGGSNPPELVVAEVRVEATVAALEARVAALEAALATSEAARATLKASIAALVA